MQLVLEKNTKSGATTSGRRLDHCAIRSAEAEKKMAQSHLQPFAKGCALFPRVRNQQANLLPLQDMKIRDWSQITVACEGLGKSKISKFAHLQNVKLWGEKNTVIV